MNILKPVKETTTIVIGVPLAFVSAAAATIALAIGWVGLSAIDRLARKS